MAESFAERWGRKWSALGREDIGTTMVACGAGVLPDQAAPCLTFDRAEHPAPIWEVFSIPSQWSAAERERLVPFRVIGSDGAGNPICLEQDTSAVVLLDHENQFHTRQFVNSGVAQLAECLLAYMGETDPERFRAAVLAIDPTAMAEGSFWWQEVAGLGRGT